MTRLTRWLAVLTLWPLAALATPAIVSGQYCTAFGNAAGPISCALPAAVTAGDKVIVFLLNDGSSSSATISDSASDTVTSDYPFTAVQPISGDYVGIAISEIDSPSTSGALTISASTGYSYRSTLYAVEVSGTGAVDALSAIASGTSSTASGTVTQNAVTTTAANDLVLSIFEITPPTYGASSITWNDSFTQVDYQASTPTSAFAYLVATSAGAVNSTVTMTSTATWGWGAIQIAWKPSGSTHPPKSGFFFGDLLRKPKSVFGTFLPAAWVIERRNGLGRQKR